MPFFLLGMHNQVVGAIYLLEILWLEAYDFLFFCFNDSERLYYILMDKVIRYCDIVMDRVFSPFYVENIGNLKLIMSITCPKTWMCCVGDNREVTWHLYHI